jgi:tetratricopeptide (TPR) repeat protein
MKRLLFLGVALAAAGVGQAIAATPPATDGKLAKVASVQNVVETRHSPDWNKAVVDEALKGGDRVRTGAASRAGILYADDTLQRIDEKTEVEIIAPSTGNSGILKVLGGRTYFTSRRPKDFGRVETPTVTAAIKGTEFSVDVADDGATTITMMEGVVLASNDQGSVEIGAGEKAVVEPGKAPVKSVVVRPRDAVSWALYYPPVLGGTDRARLASMGEDGASLTKASELLATGQVAEAKTLIDSVKAKNDPVALSLASVIALTEDRKDDARKLASQAVEADAKSPAAALASSFVAQADFDIDRAANLAEKAAGLAPDDAVALARLAELRMAQGDTRGADEAARRALARAPGDARALSVMGFIELAKLRTPAAAEKFSQALAADSGLAIAHLGEGITRMRQKELAAGREHIQTAVALDPGNSLYRSYLGKAYYEEKRSYESGRELATAKELDRSDPTPYLYDAIRLQNDNRPVEALSDLMKSIELNDNRAVYRSRLLLDEDQAVRGSDLSRVFNDLGFEDAGLVAARASADDDQANHSSHMLLAGNYRNSPGFASAYFSEVLQSRVYQPVSTNAARPDIVNQSASFNEYTSLFERPRIRAFGIAAYGDVNTDLSAYDNGALCPGGVPCYTLSQLDNSNVQQGSAVVTANGDRYAAALSYSNYQNDGYRVNADEDTTTYRGYVQYAFSDRDTIQLNAIRGDSETGDLPPRQLVPAVTPERFDTTETNIGAAWHRRLSAGSDIAFSAIYNKTEQTAMNLQNVDFGTATLDGPQLEGQWVKQLGWGSLIAGAGGFSGTVELAPANGGTSVEGDDKFANAYGYVKLRRMGPLEITAGASVEKVETPIGLLPPRDSLIVPDAISYDATKVSPKVGATATFGSGTTIRAAVYHRLAPALGRLQTLESTQVAGFNQFYDDVGGTRSWSYGAGVDQKIGARWFMGASWLKRQLDVPEGFCATPDQFSGCAGQTATAVDQRESDDDWGTAYVSGALTTWMTASLGYDYYQRDFDTTEMTSTGGFQDRVETQRFRPEMRFFAPNGLFVRLAGARYDQQVDQRDAFDPAVATASVVNSEFWVMDAAIGYRFPKRWGSFVIDGRNVFNEKFLFYDRLVQEQVVPARQVTARLEITY